MKFKLLAVIVLYNENLYDTQTYKSLLSCQTDIDLFIWDNSSSPQDIITTNCNLKYIHSIENRGISYAYNQAYEYACKNNYTWMLLLDQDTWFESNYLSVLKKKVIDNPDMKIFSPIHKLSNGKYLSPVKCYFKIPRTSKYKALGKLSLKRYAVINSGILVETCLFGRAGGYKNEVFLDYSDFQFMERVYRLNKYILSIDSVCIQHFSNEELDSSKLLDRYKLFCRSLSACDKNSLFDHFIYFIVVFKRCLALIIRLKSSTPLQIFRNYYIK